MDLKQVEALARELMEHYNLSGWNFVFDHAKRRAGSCRQNSKTITLSRHLMALYPVEAVRETILHEIAHALVGVQAKHGPEWKACAQSIGGSGKARLDPDLPRTVPNWVGTCPQGHLVERMRRPSGKLSCARCSKKFSEAHLLQWRRGK